MSRRARILTLVLLATAAAARAESTFQEKGFDYLTDKAIAGLGKAALAVREKDWKHGETDHFIYHFFDKFAVGPVSVEAEYYYGTITKDLGRATAQWERKCHIFVFEQEEDWRQFQKRGHLDPWTGGAHAQGELFIFRNAKYRFKGHALGHEITHLVLYRFFGNGVPLWLNEGFAEYAGVRGYSAFHRARGYASRPVASAVDPQYYLPITQLVAMVDYPEKDEQVMAYYHESHRLVRFLVAADKNGFVEFLDAMGKGSKFETALLRGFGAKFQFMDVMERDFKAYATKDHDNATPE